MLFKLSVISFLHFFTTQHIFVSIIRNNNREYLHKNSGRLWKIEKYLIFHWFLTWHNVNTCDWCNLTNPVTIWNVTGNMGKLLSLSRLKRKKKILIMKYKNKGFGIWANNMPAWSLFKYLIFSPFETYSIMDIRPVSWILEIIFSTGKY